MATSGSSAKPSPLLKRYYVVSIHNIICSEAAINRRKQQDCSLGWRAARSLARPGMHSTIFAPPINLTYILRVGFYNYTSEIYIVFTILIKFTTLIILCLYAGCCTVLAFHLALWQRQKNMSTVYNLNDRFLWVATVALHC